GDAHDVVGGEDDGVVDRLVAHTARLASERLTSNDHGAGDDVDVDAGASAFFASGSGFTSIGALTSGFTGAAGGLTGQSGQPGAPGLHAGTGSSPVVPRSSPQAPVSR